MKKNFREMNRSELIKEHDQLMKRRANILNMNWRTDKENARYWAIVNDLDIIRYILRTKEKEAKDLLNKFTDAVNALDVEDRGSVYMHKLDHAEDLRVELLECIDEDTPEYIDLCKKLDLAENKLQDLL